MSELVIQPLELIDVSHDDGHARAVAPGAFNFFHDAQLEKAPVENTGETIEIGKLLHALDIMRVLDGGGANVGDGFERLQVAVAEGVRLGAVEGENPERLSERDQWNAHARGGFRKKLRAGRRDAKIGFHCRVAAGQDGGPRLGARRKAAALGNARGERAVMGPQHEIVVLAQKQGDVRHPECTLNQLADAIEKLFQIQNCSGLLGDRVDGLQLERPLFLQGVQPRILQRDRRLSGEKREQIDGLGVEMVEVVALAIEHANYFVPHHQRNSDLGTSRLGGAQIARIQC